MLERNLTQREVARRADIAEVRMSRIALGKDLATDDERRAIAKVLRRGVSRLFPVEAVA
jgi:transcriptional regulator with XRE-family HTH domain